MVSCLGWQSINEQCPVYPVNLKKQENKRLFFVKIVKNTSEKWGNFIKFFGLWP